MQNKEYQHTFTRFIQNPHFKYDLCFAVYLQYLQFNFFFQGMRVMWFLCSNGGTAVFSGGDVADAKDGAIIGYVTCTSHWSTHTHTHTLISPPAPTVSVHFNIVLWRRLSGILRHFITVTWTAEIKHPRLSHQYFIHSCLCLLQRQRACFYICSSAYLDGATVRQPVSQQD